MFVYNYFLVLTLDLEWYLNSGVALRTRKKAPTPGG